MAHEGNVHRETLYDSAVVIAEVASRVWPDGGITNHNFKVTVGGETVVLRIGGKDTELLGIDRRAEYEATLAAADAGVGPEIVAFVEPEGYLVTRFIEGTPCRPTSCAARRTSAGRRRLSAASTTGARFPVGSTPTASSRCATTSPRRTALDSAASEWAHDRTLVIEAARGPQPLHPCHNDHLNANFIDDGDRIRLVDWEYAGMGDVFFDLANFSINHELEPADDERLVAEYYGESRPLDLASLRLMRFMSDFREAMWGVVRQGISELDFDFVEYADEHFERLERTAASGEFRAALASYGVSG